MAEPDLTIGELFPFDDLVAQWMFSLSAVADDLIVLLREVRKAATEREDMRVAMLLQRLLIVRLYEARRVILVAEANSEVRDFIGPRPFSPFEVLRAAYLPDGDSRVDQLYAGMRHQTVHYMWPGSDELRTALRGSWRLPARMEVARNPGDSDVDIQWVQVVSGMGSFGEFTDSGWQPRYAERGELAASLGQAWILAHGVLLIAYAHERGIDLERFVVEREPGDDVSG